MRRLLVSALALASTVGSAQAAPMTYQLDPTHADVLFAIDHLGFSMAHGIFREVTGTLTLDADHLDAGAVDITVKAASIDTLNDARDKDLRSEHFFDAAKFPDIRFVSTKVTRTGDKTARVEGNLTMHGVTKPVVLATTLNKLGDNPLAKKPSAGFTATGSLKRSDFGVSYFMGPLGDDVAITIDAEFHAG